MNSQPHEDIQVSRRFCYTLYKLNLYEPINPLHFMLEESIREMGEWLDNEAKKHVPIL